MLSNIDFKFLWSDPSSNCYCITELYKKREKLINICFEDIKIACSLKQGMMYI